MDRMDTNHKTLKAGMERGLSGEEHWLLYQNTRIQYPAPIWSLQPPETPVPRDPVPSSGLRAAACTWFPEKTPVGIK